MSSLDKYDEIFIRCFDLEKKDLNDGFVYQSISAWDSVGHMTLMADIEEGFDIMMETDDIIEFSSYEIGKEILKKYGVEVN